MGEGGGGRGHTWTLLAGRRSAWLFSGGARCSSTACACPSLWLQTEGTAGDDEAGSESGGVEMEVSIKERRRRQRWGGHVSAASELFRSDPSNSFDRPTHDSSSLIGCRMFHNLPLPSDSGSQNFEKLSAALKPEGKKSLVEYRR